MSEPPEVSGAPWWRRVVWRALHDPSEDLVTVLAGLLVAALFVSVPIAWNRDELRAADAGQGVPGILRVTERSCGKGGCSVDGDFTSDDRTLSARAWADLDAKRGEELHLQFFPDSGTAYPLDYSMDFDVHAAILFAVVGAVCAVVLLVLLVVAVRDGRVRWRRTSGPWTREERRELRRRREPPRRALTETPDPPARLRDC